VSGRLTGGPDAFWLVRGAALGVAACAFAPWAAVPGRTVAGIDQSAGRATLVLALVGLVGLVLLPPLPAAALEAALGVACLALATASRTPYLAPAVVLTQLLGLVWAGAAGWGAHTFVAERRLAAAVTPAAPPRGSAPAAPPDAPAPPR
jgi:hypothetical protein